LRSRWGGFVGEMPITNSRKDIEIERACDLVWAQDYMATCAYASLPRVLIP
jgi:hypothetical protein